ncbi:DUF3333 domain-containing protein, partial [Rhizobium johnstonii]
FALISMRSTDPSVLIAGNYPVLLRDAIFKQLNVNASSRPDVRDASAMLSKWAPIQLRDMVMADPSIIGKHRDIDRLA